MYPDLTTRDKRREYSQLFHDSAPGFPARWGGAWICVECGHLCECGEDE